MPECHAIPDLAAQTSVVSVFNQVPLATMAEAQLKDSVLGLVIPFIHKGVKPKVLAIAKIRCKAARKYLLQFDRLVLKKGVLHRMHLAYEVFVKNYGIPCLDNFDCPTGVSPLLFSQLCVYHHCKAGGLHSDSVTLNINAQQQLPKKKPKILPSIKMGC